MSVYCLLGITPVCTISHSFCFETDRKRMSLGSTKAIPPAHLWNFNLKSIVGQICARGPDGSSGLCFHAISKAKVESEPEAL